MASEATLELTEASDPYCLSELQTERLLYGAPWRRLVVIGDSVAAGVREPLAGYRDLSTAERVANALGVHQPELLYRNLAVRELRVGEIRERQLGEALGLEPDIVIVSAGGNDALRRSFDASLVGEELTSLIAPLRDSGALVVVVGLFDLARSGLVPEPYAEPMAERFDRLDAVSAAVAHKLGAVHVDNHHHPLAADRSLFASDRMHANARGHAIAATNLFHAVAPQVPS
jgi:lysophospholipase L1-like esterase